MNTVKTDRKMWKKSINITNKANSEYVLTNMIKIWITLVQKKDLEFTLKIVYIAKNDIFP